MELRRKNREKKVEKRAETEKKRKEGKRDR